MSQITSAPKEAISSLSVKAEELLISVRDSQVEGFRDDRGYYAEFDAYGCKPVTNETIIELHESGLVVFHADSDVADRKRTITGGTAFIMIPEPLLEYIPEM